MSGATDDEIVTWVGEHANERPRIEIIKWNNKLRDQRLSVMSDEMQEYRGDCIKQFIPRNRVIYHWFDVCNIEEERI